MTRLTPPAELSLSAVERVVAEVSNGIRYGRYGPGQRLIESELSAVTDVSRGTVRDALRRLEADGLVETTKNRGASIRRLSRRIVAELSEIRGVLEGHAAALAAARATRSDVDLMRDQEGFWRDPSCFDPDAYSTYNVDFHGFITRLSGSSRLPQFIQHTNLSIFRLQFQFILLTPDRIRLSRGEHRKIIDAIAGHDPAGADRAMRDHVGTSTRLILSAPVQYFSHE